MEYQVRTDRSIDRNEITAAILHWLRNAHPVTRGVQAGTVAGSFGQRATAPGGAFGLSAQPGRAGSPFGSPTRPGPAPVGPSARGRIAGPTYPITSPGHNIHSRHQMQVTGEISIAPHLFIRQTRTTGGVHHHLFVLGDRSVLTVQQQGYHYQWGHLGQSWHKPLVVAHPPALQPADLTASLVQQALQHNASAVSQMSAWQKLLWAAMEGCRSVNLVGAIWEDVIKPMLTWESAAILLGILVLCAIPYVGEVVLVLLMGAAIYDLVTRVVGLFKQYYEAAINATSYEGLQQAAKFFSRAIIGGLLDVLGIIAGGGALARIRLLRAQGQLTVSAWLEAMGEWGQQLMRQLRSGGKMLERLYQEAKNLAKGKKLAKLSPELEKYAAIGLDQAKLQAAYDTAPDKAAFLAELDKAPTIYAKQEMIRDFSKIPGVVKRSNPENGLKNGISYRGKTGKGNPALDLPDREAANFAEAHQKYLKPGTKLYRVVGGSARDTGGYWVTEENLPKNHGDVIGGTAVKPSWGNSMTEVIEYTVPEEGMVVWEGPAASQPIGNPPSPGHHLPGGDNQVYVPEVYRDYKKPDVLDKFKGNITKRTPIKWKK